LPSLVLGYLSITLPLSMWLMWAFLRSIPLEVEEAGLLNGASRFQVFRLIVLPLAVPGIVDLGGLMMAAAVLITLPLAVLFMFVQRQLVVGFGAGAVKG